MSKELEALKKVRNGSYDDYHSTSFENIYSKEFDMLEQALTPPTEEEVCKALSEYYGFEVMYEDLDFFPKDTLRLSYLYCVVAMVDGCIDFADPLPPHLITLIGRFYEGGRK